MFDKVKEIISKYTEAESITEDLSLTQDLMLTSLDVVSMVGDFEDAFDIEIADEDVMQIKTVGDLSECNFGDWEGKSAVELAGDPSFVSWLQNSDQFPPPHGESGKQFALRICKAFEHIVNEVISSNITASAIITHGGIIMTLLSVYGIPQAQSHQWRMDNGYGFAVRVTPSLWFRDKIVEVFDTVPFAPKPKKSSHDDMEFFE